jgi:D-serine deaminase-like pyridoxal phosphate-dependent protein
MTDEQMHRTLIGRRGSRSELNTPVLVLDLDALKRNIAQMARFAETKGLNLRPHTKTHKSVHIAQLQREAGAVGFSCAKLGEAEVLADQGLNMGLLLTSPVVSAPAIKRLAELNRRTEGLMCVVDNPKNVRDLGEAAKESGKNLNVLIDIDPGIHRTGVTSPEKAVELLDEVRRAESLSYMGVQFYCGVQQHIADYSERKAAMCERAVYLRNVLSALNAAGAPPAIVTGCGTGTHRIDAGLDLYTELQVGSYVFMDSQYLDCDIMGDGTPAFETSLMVEASVISANSPGMITLDCGYKTLSTDGSLPRVISGAPREARFVFMGDEHGALIFGENWGDNWGDNQPPHLGGRIVMTTPHCDPTVNLYDFYHVIQGDTLTAIWPVSARGRSR